MKVISFVSLTAPKIFTFVFGMVKPLLHQMTQDKIRIFGFDKDEWKAALLEDIDADQLPAYYGGTLTDPDGNPKCPSKVMNQLIYITDCVSLPSSMSSSSKLYTAFINEETRL